MDESKHESAAAAMRQINQAWLRAGSKTLRRWCIRKLSWSFPISPGRFRAGREFLAGFRDFCQNATIQEFHEHDQQVDVVGDTAVITFRYGMVYERSGERYRATGRDLWVFRQQDGVWIAVWRAMLEMKEDAA